MGCTWRTHRSNYETPFFFLPFGVDTEYLEIQKKTANHYVSTALYFAL